jgi:hypothetical protein
MTAPTNSPGRPTTEPPPSDRPTYEGSRFPWWMVMFWVVFLIFAVTYHLLYVFPDLRLWLTDTAGQMWK